jgi:PhnB protein
MTGMVPYLHFPGNARAVLEYYADVFGGSVTANTFAEFGRTDGDPEWIAHGFLKESPVELFAADAGEGEESLSVKGLMFSLLGTAEPVVLQRWFGRLAEGGTIVDDLQRREWGASDGQVIDRFGMLWLIGFED